MSQIEHTNTKEVLLNEHWLIDMQHELNQFKRNELWDIVLPPRDH